jgi:hypothetical protein
MGAVPRLKLKLAIRYNYCRDAAEYLTLDPI